ncbi:RNA polymerase sigma factor [Plebeiibacterium marinum]|uniref:RNA polymerase sigma-70 factor n=1 Tax=Plebeiibacterium marinum TaxID=2992111 RepID=A0AAE3MED1_9BACT|nr:RNA polymerase sigma-70 factor [Plebeiobacterium marinum]MCW3805502.1 RNA polymerase sigma-70 factor [Plebeiobacterium marinum]
MGFEENRFSEPFTNNFDYTSFNELFNLYYPRLCAYAYQITKNPTASEDIVQEVFIRLWKGRKELNIKGDIFNYLLKACKNASLNFLRSESSRRKTLEEIPEKDSINDMDLIEEQELVDFVQQCIDLLPQRSRQVFLMSRFEGLKQQEIAERLGTSIKTIKNQIWKSLQYLRTCLKEKDAI